MILTKKKTTCQSQVGLGFSSIANLLVRSARKAQWPFGKEGPMAIFAMAHFSSDRDVQHHYIAYESVPFECNIDIVSSTGSHMYFCNLLFFSREQHEIPKVRSL